MEYVPWIFTAVASSVIVVIHDIALGQTLVVFSKHRKQWSAWRYSAENRSEISSMITLESIIIAADSRLNASPSAEKFREVWRQQSERLFLVRYFKIDDCWEGSNLVMFSPFE